MKRLTKMDAIVINMLVIAGGVNDTTQKYLSQRICAALVAVED